MELEELKKIIAERSSYRGLTTRAAKERLALFGPNARPTKKKITWLSRLLRIVSEPMMVILAVSIIPIIFIQFFQQKKTDDALTILDRLLTEECAVYRDGVLTRRDIRDLVPGD